MFTLPSMWNIIISTPASSLLQRTDNTTLNIQADAHEVQPIQSDLCEVAR